MTPADLRRYGEALYGERWQVPLARAIDVAERSVRYWIAGRPIPDGVEDDLRRLAQQRIAELRRLA